MYDSDAKRLVTREIEYTPALYKIFDEILVNATDHKQRCKAMKRIAITIDPDRNEISVFNDGTGIPVCKHKSWGTYVIEGIFGHLLCGSNFNDNKAKTTGGRNGYGAKLTNVYSKRFVVETYSYKDKKTYKQVWRNNMSECSNPVIKDIAKSALRKNASYTKITFRPDLKRFKMTKLDDDIVDLMTKRCYDAAAVSHCEVTLNGVPIQVKSFEQYVKMVLPAQAAEQNKIVSKTINKRWEIAVTLSPDSSFKQISFVNGIATTKGGTHVKAIESQILKHLVSVMSKKAKSLGLKVTKNSIRNHLFICVNCLVENPSFDSQTKEQLTTPPANFGSTCDLPKSTLKQIAGMSSCVHHSRVREHFNQKNNTRTHTHTHPFRSRHRNCGSHHTSCNIQSQEQCSTECEQDQTFAWYQEIGRREQCGYVVQFEDITLSMTKTQNINARTQVQFEVRNVR